MNSPLSWMEGFARALPPWFFAPIVSAVWVLTLWLVKRIAMRRFRQWAKRTSVHWDDLVVEALGFPLNLLIFVSGALLLESLLPLSPRVDRMAGLVLQASVIVAFVAFADRIIRGFLLEGTRSAFGPISSQVAAGLLRGFALGLAILVLLDLAGISITPILASLGIGSLAVALALQDTLSNFFAGIYIAIDKPVAPGDYVKVDNVEGYVTEVGWRSTRIRTLPNNQVVIPNSKITSSIITNYHVPGKEMGITFDMGVHYDSDLQRVERVAFEVAKEIQTRVDGAMPGFEPMVRFHTFADSSVNFTVVLQAREFTDQYLLKHEFIKAVHERFRKEGIVIPYPIRTIDLPRGTEDRLRAVPTPRS